MIALVDVVVFHAVVHAVAHVVQAVVLEVVVDVVVDVVVQGVVDDVVAGWSLDLRQIVRLLARSRFQSRRSRSMLSLAHRLAVDVRCRRRLVGRVVCLAMLHVLDARAVDVNVSPLSLHQDFQVPFQGFSILIMWPCCMSSMLGPWTTRVHTRTFVIRLSCGRPRTRSRVPCTAHTNLSDAIAFSDDHTDVHVTHSKSWSIVSFSIPLL